MADSKGAEEETSSHRSNSNSNVLRPQSHSNHQLPLSPLSKPAITSPSPSSPSSPSPSGFHSPSPLSSKVFGSYSISSTNSHPSVPKQTLERGYSNNSSLSSTSTSQDSFSNSDADSTSTANTKENLNASPFDSSWSIQQSTSKTSETPQEQTGGDSSDGSSGTISNGSTGKMSLSELLNLKPVSKLDWERWIKGGGLGESSEGINGKAFGSKACDFWNQNGYLPAPRNPQTLKLKRREVLLRHGFSNPAALLPILARSTRLARQNFQIEYAAFSVVGFENLDEVLVFGGFKSQNGMHRMARTGSVCSHALLGTQVPVLFHIPDLDADFRFARNPNLFSQDGSARLRFYISVPLTLSSGNGDESVVVGRMCLLSQHLREWSDLDSEMLKDLSSMTSDSLEKLQQRERAKKMELIQRSLTFLTRSIDEGDLLDHSKCYDSSCGLPEMQKPSNRYSTSHSKNSSIITSDGFHYCPRRVELACSSIQTVLGAISVLAIDLSDFKTYNPRPFNPSLSPRNSLFPLSPWSPHSNLRSSINSSDSPFSAERRGSTQVSGSSGFKNHSHSRLNSNVSVASPKEVDFCPVPSTGLGLISGAGEVEIGDLAEEMGTETQRKQVSNWLGNWKLNERKTLPVIYDISSPFKSSTVDDEDVNNVSGDGKDFEAGGISNPLVSLLPDPETTAQYVALPIFNLSDQPMFVVLATFEKKTLIEQESLLFVENASMVIRSSIIRQQIGAAEETAKLFVQQVQHELRTPLHAILGIADLLQQSVPEEGGDAPVDLTDPTVLNSLLTGIQLAGNNLDTILESVLDLSQASGVSDLKEAAKMEMLDLSRMLEGLSLNALTHLSLTLNVGEGNLAQEMKATFTESDKGTRLPPLMINIDPVLLNTLCGVNSISKLKKILGQIISNAVRFVSEGTVSISARLIQIANSQALELRVKDTGCGMTKDFVETELLRPFRKGNFYRQGVGLGMALAGNLCSAIGADLKVESEIGVGTEVLLVLPCEAVPKKKDSLISPQFKSVYFVGFESESSKQVKDFLSANLLGTDLELCEDAESAEVLICSQDTVALDGVLVASQPKCSRILVVSSSLTIPRSNSLLPGIAILTLTLPYGPTALKTTREFLRAELRPPMEQRFSDLHLINDQATSDPATFAAKEKEKALTAAAITSVASVLPPSVGQKIEFKVLIVEDNPLNLRLLTTLCSRMKIPTESAMDGADAVIKFLAFKPSLVLLDISLPIQDGFAAAVQMRSHVSSHQTTIVAVTALSSPEDKIRGQDAGINDWRVKPVSMRELRQDLDTWRREWNERSHVAETEESSS